MCFGIFSNAYAGVGDAYLFGPCIDGVGEINASEEMNYIHGFMIDMGYSGNVYENPLTKKFTDKRLNSSFLYVSGHGATDLIDTGYNRGIDLYGETGFKEISNVDFSNNILTVLAACYAGKEDHGKCVAQTIRSNGGGCILAWQNSPNILSTRDFTKRFMYYVQLEYTFLQARNKTEQYLTTKKGMDSDAAVLQGVTLFGSYNNNFVDASHLESSLKRKSLSIADPIETYIDDEITQDFITDTVEYKANSEDYDQIIDYIIKNIDSNFNYKDYQILEDGEDETGYNSLSFRLMVNQVPSKYGFNIICLDGKARLINFTDTYMEFDEAPTTATRTLKTNDLTEDISDDTLFEMAINDDGYDFKVSDQYIEKQFDLEKNKVINEVNTVYKDENHHYFCTLNIY
ncbi:MAG: hypothetical protein PHX08_05800 [Lachnospiraceae bacterium]|nr:hypothetical protein [Lachnospiraceae bacterium]